MDPQHRLLLEVCYAALEDAGLTDMPEADRYRVGVSIGAGIGGLPGIEKESIVLHEKGPRRVSPPNLTNTPKVKKNITASGRVCCGRL